VRWENNASYFAVTFLPKNVKIDSCMSKLQQVKGMNFLVHLVYVYTYIQGVAEKSRPPCDLLIFQLSFRILTETLRMHLKFLSTQVC